MQSRALLLGRTQPIPSSGSASVESVPDTRIGAVDGLRAIAISLVLLWHLTPGHYSSDGLRSLFFKTADIGWSGVDLFFVLSGFLITGILLRAKDREQPLRHFLARRFLRILPAYYLALALTFLVIPQLPGSYERPPFWAQLPYWIYLENFALSGEGVSTAPISLGHFWSLAVEMQFYLLWPLIIYRCSTRTIWRIAVAALLIAAVGRGIATHVQAHWNVWFMWTPFRWDGLIVGAMAALAVDKSFGYQRAKPLLWAGAAIGGGFVFLVAWFGWATAIFKTSQTPLDIALKALLPLVLSLTFGAILLISLQPNRLSLLLGHRLFKPLALYSYGIYIVHFMLLQTFQNAFGPEVLRQWIGGRDAPIYAYFLIASTFSFVIAMISYHLFEVHFLRLKVKFNSMPLGRPKPGDGGEST